MRGNDYPLRKDRIPTELLHDLTIVGRVLDTRPLPKLGLERVGAATKGSGHYWPESKVAPMTKTSSCPG
jgi:hypothetical protein